MRRIVVPEKNKLIRELTSKDNKDIVFSISPQKKAHLESLVSNKNPKVVRILKEWMETDKGAAFLKKMVAESD